MSDFDRNYSAVRGFGADRAVAFDQGLRAHMIRVYNYMAAGVALTGVIAFVVAQYAMSDPSFAKTLYGSPLAYVVMLAPIFLVYTQSSIARVFFITATMFGGLSLYGYTTQRNLAPMGAFLMMGLIGIFIAGLVNLFLHSSSVQWIVSVVGVLVFAGLTAWHTQEIKEMYDPMDDGTVAGRKAVLGAWALYADFVNMFLFLLRLLGDRR